MGLLPVMKLILFNPPAPDGRGFTREGRCTQEAGVWASQWPPVTLATAAAFLAGDGHEVHGVDFPALGLPVRDLEARIAALRPDAPLRSATAASRAPVRASSGRRIDSA